MIGQVGGNLTIISQQDTSKQHLEQSSQGGGGSWSSSGNGASAKTSNQNANGNYASVNEQSGIFAGQGGFDLTVGGHTSLVGAVIDSTATPDKNQLTTASLSVADIHNQSDYSATTRGLGIELGDRSNITPALPMSESGHDSSETRSAIAAGTITITDEAAQKARTGQTAEEVLASLNRDTANAHQGPLAQNPDLQEILDKQAEIVDAAGKAGPAVAKTIGDIAKSFTREYEAIEQGTENAKKVLADPNASPEAKLEAEKYLQAAEQYLAQNPQIVEDYENWKEGSFNKIVLQAAGAALVAQIGNGSGLDAALGAAANQLATRVLQDQIHELTKNISDNPAANELIAQIIGNAIATGVGYAAGGETGANATSTMDRYNRQLHPNELAWLQDNEKINEFTQWLCETKGDCSLVGKLDEARAVLTQQALRQVDFAWRYFLGDEKPIDTLAGYYLLTFSGVTIPDGKAQDQGFIARSDGDYLNYRLFLNEANNNLDFYKENVFGGILPDRTINGLQARLLAAMFVGPNGGGMGSLPQGLVDSYSKDGQIMNWMMVDPDVIESLTMQGYGSLVADLKAQYEKNLNACGGDQDCASAKMNDGFNDLVNSHLAKLVESTDRDTKILNVVYNNEHMDKAQGFEYLTDLLIGLVATRGITTSITNGIKNKITSAGVNGVDNAAHSLLNYQKIKNQLLAEEISSGHAFNKHISEFSDLGITTQNQLAAHIENIVNNPTASKQLSNGRMGYWDQSTGTVVIRNPNASDGGTVFRPTAGRAYFDNMLK